MFRTDEWKGGWFDEWLIVWMDGWVDRCLSALTKQLINNTMHEKSLPTLQQLHNFGSPCEIGELNEYTPWSIARVERVLVPRSLPKQVVRGTSCVTSSYTMEHHHTTAITTPTSLPIIAGSSFVPSVPPTAAFFCLRESAFRALVHSFWKWNFVFWWV